jgi:uncharacterized protein (DUF2141 family)
MFNYFKIFCLGCLFFSFTNTEKPTDYNLYLNLSNIRNTEGYLYVFVYNFENQYPYEPFKYYKVAKNKVKDGKLKVIIKNLPFHNYYALTLIDDENNNEDLDRWLGIPSEGYGFSNNINPLFSLPEYKELIFTPKSNLELDIFLRYVL